ncbi:MAG: hypothetical protein OEY91_14375 [Nitrospirota bacterium]|nr:hypothetical protein [Nitrospirota bacterium]
MANDDRRWHRVNRSRYCRPKLFVEHRRTAACQQGNITGVFRGQHLNSFTTFAPFGGNRHQ